jgi:hypothetical protein
MPLTPSLPTWLAINNANFTSSSGLTDPDSGQPVFAGGLNLGDYFDATNGEASNASYATNGKLYAGRYRLVQVDSGATAANVKTGTVGYLRAGGTSGTVTGVIITNAGTGATAGTYTVAANYGAGGSGAVIQVVVASTGLITSATVLNGGYGYDAVPTFSLTATGTTAGAVAAQLDTSPNIVTSYDQVSSGTTGVAVRPVVFLNPITPGNYGFIQELGTATLLAGGAITAANFVSTTTGGVVTGGTTYTVLTVGQAIDTGTSGQLFKAVLTGPTVQD